MSAASASATAAWRVPRLVGGDDVAAEEGRPITAAPIAANATSCVHGKTAASCATRRPCLAPLMSCCMVSESDTEASGGPPSSPSGAGSVTCADLSSPHSPLAAAPGAVAIAESEALTGEQGVSVRC